MSYNEEINTRYDKKMIKYNTIKFYSRIKLFKKTFRKIWSFAKRVVIVTRIESGLTLCEKSDK